jgi:hypothetical protein
LQVRRPTRLDGLGIHYLKLLNNALRISLEVNGVPWTAESMVRSALEVEGGGSDVHAFMAATRCVVGEGNRVFFWADW